VQHHDITAEILATAKVKPTEKIDGRPFLKDAVKGKPGKRDHVTVGWGSASTVITKRWWLNCKVDGTGALLHDLKIANPFAKNVARKHPKIVDSLFSKAVEDAEGGFPDWLVDMSKKEKDAPGCSDLAARK